MPLERLLIFLAIFNKHCPNAKVEMSHDDPRTIKVIYNTEHRYLKLNDFESILFQDHHVNLYDGYAEIML